MFKHVLMLLLLQTAVGICHINQDISRTLLGAESNRTIAEGGMAFSSGERIAMLDFNGIFVPHGSEIVITCLFPYVNSQSEIEISYIGSGIATELNSITLYTNDDYDFIFTCTVLGNNTIKILFELGSVTQESDVYI